MKTIKKILLTTLLLIMGVGMILVSIFNDEKQNNNFNSTKPYIARNSKNESEEPKFKDLLPADFFGDYSNPEFWTNWEKKEDLPVKNALSWEKPYPMHDFYKVNAHKGYGINTWTEYTKVYNQVVNEGIYKHKWNLYNDWVKANPNGFGYLDSEQINLKMFCAYVEDWMVWNLNENHPNILHKKITNKDLIFHIEYGDNKLTDVEDIDLKFKLKDFAWEGTACVFHFFRASKLSDADDYIISFGGQYEDEDREYDSDQTLDPYGWNLIYDDVVGNVWEASGYSINRLFIPKHKNSISDSFDKEKYKTDVKDYLKKNKKFNLEQFSKKSDELIKFNLNKKFLENKYVSPKWIDYGNKQGYYLKENPFKKDDYKVGYKLTNEGKSILVSVKSVNNLSTKGEENINLEIKIPQPITAKQTKDYTWIYFLAIGVFLIVLILFYLYKAKKTSSKYS